MPARIHSSCRRSRFFLEHNDSVALLNDVYEVETQPLGAGGFGTVSRARLRGADSVVRAVKAIPKRNVATESMVQDEIAILRSLDHPYICRLFETFHESKCIYLVMEYVDGQELFDYIQQSFLGNQLLNEDFTARVMHQVFSALHYCHCRAVVHRDLKPENIMVRRVVVDSPHQPEIKLIDFGLAACYTRPSRPASGSIVGTFSYLAPEVCYSENIHPASDLWSAGMVLHTLLVGFLPPEDVRIGEEPLDMRLVEYSDISATAKELLAGLLQPDPDCRLTAAEAGVCAWFKEARASRAPQQVAKTMDAFTSFHQITRLHRAVLTALAMQLADQQVLELQRHFLSADGDKNGRVSRDELASHIARGSPGFVEDVMGWVESIFDSVDTDGSDEIEYTEWVAAALHEGTIRCDQAIRAAFRVFDTDGSGKISQHEIARITMQSPSDIACLMPQVDLDGDGELNFEEFRELIRSSLSLSSPSAIADKHDGVTSSCASTVASSCTSTVASTSGSTPLPLPLLPVPERSSLPSFTGMAQSWRSVGVQWATRRHSGLWLKSHAVTV